MDRTLESPPLVVARTTEAWLGALRRKRRAAEPVVVYPVQGHGVKAMCGEPAHLPGEVRRAHEQFGQRSAGRRSSDDVVHEDRHGAVVSRNGCIAAGGCKEKGKNGENRRRVR